MSNIIEFRIKRRPSREHAIRWLSGNVKAWPTCIPDGWVGIDMFHGWRFVMATDGLIYFANCIEQGICEQEFSASAAQARNDN